MFKPVVAMCGVALAIAALPALAQSRPLFLPTRDVAVTYQLSGGQGQGPQVTHLYFSASLNKLRIDTPGNAGYTVLDKGAGKRLMVMNQERSYVALPIDPSQADGFVLNNGMNFVPDGQSNIAGVACEKWRVSSAQTSGSACVAADGVLLSGEGRSSAGETRLVATDVQYGPQPAYLFEPPQGFQRMDAEQVQQGQGQQGQPPPQGQ